MADNELTTLQSALAEVAKMQGEIETLRQEHALIVGDLEAQLETEKSRTADLARRLRTYELAEAQEVEQ